jgi:hypothetical protein
MTGMSAICGRLRMRTGSSVSSDAAISFSALFLAPGTRTVPCRGVPPCTT